MLDDFALPVMFLGTLAGLSFTAAALVEAWVWVADRRQRRAMAVAARRYGRGGEMEAWRTVWRQGVAPELSTAGLTALRQALLTDSEELAQGCTTEPPPLHCVLDWPVEKACPIAYCGWRGDGLDMVGDVEAFFAKVCFEADNRIGEPAAVRYLLNWADETPRDEMRRLLLPEVERALAERAVA